MFNDQKRCILTQLLCLCIVFGRVWTKEFNSSFTSEHVKHLRQETKELFNFAWTSYMNYGFPYDEVRPISCEPYGPDYKDMYNIIRNDAMGNVSSTVLDNLDTLIIMEEWDQLEQMLDYLNFHKTTLFDKNTIVQVFESTIRSLGGLLSTHLLLADVTKDKVIPDKYKRFKEISDNYDGFLLDLAYDLGLRLIPAFKTSNSIPLPRINLAKGLKAVPTKLQSENCLAGATTPVLELTLLSKLTGDPQFEYYSQATYWKLWISRSNLDLLPMTINPNLNQWMDSITGIGASVDSFYEYSAKGSILFDDPYMWSVFKSSYKALLTYSVIGGGPNEGSMVFANVGVYDGYFVTNWIDSLSAFWPGLQVLTGQLTDAIKTHLVYLKIWDSFDSIPERWVHYVNDGGSEKLDANRAVSLEWYPLRPEFIESTYYLFRATRDPMYLQIGERILNLFKSKFKTNCGFSGFQDIRTGKMQDRMETFVMGETLKYLYLLFDDSNEVFLHSDLMKNKNWIFSTEAHPLWLNKNVEYKPSSNPTGLLKTQDNKWSDSLLNSKEFSLNLYNIPPSFYRNISTPQVLSADIPGNDSKIHKHNPYDVKFDTCELNQFSHRNESFISSFYYSWDQTFYADHKYYRTLVKPSHISQSSLDGSCIELTPHFYDKYTMFKPVPGKLHLQCPHPSTTVQYELFLGNINHVNSVEISQITIDESLNTNLSSNIHAHLHSYSQANVPRTPWSSVVRNGDLWVPYFNESRVRMEVLVEGAIDTTNTVITNQYLDLFLSNENINDNNTTITHNHTTIDTNASSFSLQTSASSANMLRLIKINGLVVTPGTVVWILPFPPVLNQDGNPPLMFIDDYKRVIINGSMIENVHLWGGGG